MDKLADELWCTVCNQALSLRFLVNEKRQGIASQCLVQCQNCHQTMIVQTSSENTKYYDSNIKLAVGMLDTGVGETKINGHLSALNIPTANVSSLKRWERCVGSVAEELAQEACIEEIEKEKKLTLENNRKENKENEIDANGNVIVDLTASFDTAWTKRGRQHNSLSGHSSLFGLFGKGILAYTCRNIYCVQCKKNSNKIHNCKKNHEGSSRSMEADMAMELVLKNNILLNSNCRIRTLIGDDDSSAIAQLRRLSPYTIHKLSDFNHVKKTFNSKLYEIKLSANLREYFSKCFSLAIKKKQR